MNRVVKISVAAVLFGSLMAFTQVSKRVVKSSKISFVIKNLGVGVDGTLKNLKVRKFVFDNDSLAKSAIDVTVDVKTINTGIKKRDEHLRKKDYFDAATYPTIRMRSKRFGRSKKGNVIGYFNLTMKGKTKEVKLPVYVTETSDGTTFKSTFTVNRRDFGIGSGSLALSDNAKITIFVKTN